jgi:hypothetical protein
MFLVRPFVGSQHGRCPAYPPESCIKLKASGSDVYGESKPQFFSKMTPTPSSQERSSPPHYPTLTPLTPITRPPPPAHLCPSHTQRVMRKANSELYIRKANAEKIANITHTLKAHKAKSTAESVKVVQRMRMVCERETAVAVLNATAHLASDRKKSMRGVRVCKKCWASLR